MDKFDRIFQLHLIFSVRRSAIDQESLMARLECSRSTLFRAVALMKDHLGAPIKFDADAGGFLYERDSSVDSYELPGLWFSAAELQCLAVLQRLLADLGGGLLGEQVAAIGKRLNQLISHRRLNLGQAAARLRFPSIAARPAGESFQVAASATLQRKKLWFEYHSRGSNRHSERTVSPQRLVHYRDAWYLDGWDDGSNGLRTFSIERVSRPRVISSRARDISETELDEHFASGYGIFGGKADKTATLRFTSERARWVADEEWHPAQKGTFQPDGSYELLIPYLDPRELVMDILRHGPHVQVIEPPALRDEVKRQLAEALKLY
jgi:predicted DNA-binding transcriptional regulator YafY